VDRGEACHQHKLHNNQEVFLEKHHMSLRRPESNHIREHKTVRQYHVGILQSDRDKGCLHLSLSPANQCCSRVERANALIFEAIKKILKGKKKGKWAEVMLKVVRSHNTSVSRATNISPFWLFFRAEAVPLEEIKHKST
jgi:hypothetical protein